MAAALLVSLFFKSSRALSLYPCFTPNLEAGLASNKLSRQRRSPLELVGRDPPKDFPPPAPVIHANVGHRVSLVYDPHPRDAPYRPLGNLHDDPEGGSLVGSGNPPAVLCVRALGGPRPAVSFIAAPLYRDYLEVRLVIGCASSLRL